MGALAPALVRFSLTLAEIEANRSILNDSLLRTFSEPIAAFVDTEASEAKNLHRRLAKHTDEYESRMSSLLHPFLDDKKKGFFKAFSSKKEPLPPTAAEKENIAHKLDEIWVAQRDMELTRHDLVRHYNHLEATKKCELVETVCAALYAHKAFFHQCYELTKELEPRMMQLQVRSMHIYHGIDDLIIWGGGGGVGVAVLWVRKNRRDTFLIHICIHCSILFTSCCACIDPHLPLRRSVSIFLSHLTPPSLSLSVSLYLRLSLSLALFFSFSLSLFSCSFRSSAKMPPSRIAFGRRSESS